MTEDDRIKTLSRLSGEVQADDRPFVDLTALETLPPAVAHRALSGQLICGDEAAFRRFKAAVESEHDATADEAERHHRSVIDRIANGGLRGG